MNTGGKELPGKGMGVLRGNGRIGNALVGVSVMVLEGALMKRQAIIDIERQTDIK